MQMNSVVTLEAWHQPVSPFVTQTAAGPLLSLWLRAATWPEQALLRTEPDNEERLVTMSLAAEWDDLRLYQAHLPLHLSSSRQRYAFKLLWPDQQVWLAPTGLSHTPPERLRQYVLEVPDSHPSWVADQVFYQIFPDRFAPGHGEHLVREAEYLHHARQRRVRRRNWEHPLETEAASSTFYGGDLDAITGKLDYLQGLGVTALYLNPIFTAPTVHKYDTTDYYQVDPHFGGNAALVRLRQATRQRQMRLILDGVFNHTGDTHSWFDRYATSGGHGACQSADSPYRNWYSFKQGKAVGWLGHADLPKLNYAEPAVAEQIYRNKDSVVRHWLREPYAIDGWRLDVVHMLGEEGSAKHNLTHLAGIRQAAREENPQAYMLGEHFGDAREWLQAGVEDGAMNYMGFNIPLRAFLAHLDVAYHPIRIDAAECAHWLEHYRAGLSHTTQLCQFNQLDSHDTARLFTLLGEDHERMKLALGWLFSWIGVPCLFYGDEIGLPGGNDPFCRAPFPWDQSRWHTDLLAHTQHWARLRHESAALRRGALQLLFAEGETLVFVRLLQHERVLVAIQRSGQRTLDLASPLLACPEWQRQAGNGQLHQQGSLLTLTLDGCGISLFRGFTH